MRYSFRICFERECETKEDAEEFLDIVTDNIWKSGTMSALEYELETAGVGK